MIHDDRYFPGTAVEFVVSNMCFLVSWSYFAPEHMVTKEKHFVSMLILFHYITLPEMGHFDLSSTSSLYQLLKLYWNAL